MALKLQERPIDKSLPSLSHRTSIAWQSLDDPITERPPGNEDSAVLVLSSRSYLPSRHQNTFSPDTEENNGRNSSLPVLMYIDLRLSLPLLPTSSVSWAFAGLRHTLRLEPPKYRWDHPIDSRKSGCVGDIGEILVLDGKEVEVGEGFNPDSGVVERYFETWRSVYSLTYYLELSTHSLFELYTAMLNTQRRRSCSQVAFYFPFELLQPSPVHVVHGCPWVLCYFDVTNFSRATPHCYSNGPR